MNWIPKELICDECASESEIIVDRKAEVEIIRIEGRILCHKPTSRSKLCYYHNKKKRGRFGQFPN